MLLRAALVALSVTLAACSGKPGSSLPPVVSERTVYDFQMRFDEGRVVGKTTHAPKSAYLFVGAKKAQLTEGGNRPAVILPAPSEIAFDVPVPDADCVLRFSLGLGYKDGVEPACVRYEVLLDGKTVCSDELRQTRKTPQDVNWAVDWKDVEVPLDQWRGRTTNVVFRTTLKEGPADAPVSAGFATARVVQKTPHDRLPAADEHWNVVVALVDTTRADHLSAYGYSRPTTPHLEKLAKEGVLYTNAISQASWTWPATASVLSSRYPHAHGILDADRCYLDDSIDTLADVFQTNGYSTYGISANALICRAQNFNQGFETFVEAWRWPADRVTDDFLGWLEKNEKHTFFAYLHYMDPHHPYTPPEAARQAVAPDMFGPDDLETLLRIKDGQANMREVQKLHGHVEHLKALYDAEIRHWDDQFARLVDVLRAKGILDRTIIVMTSDHGEEFWEHGHIGHAKTLYQELIHVPLVVWAPKLATPERVTSLVETIDIFPTLCAAIGVSPPSGTQGRRLPGISGVKPPEKRRDEAHSTTELAWVDGEAAEGDQKMEFRSQEALVGERMKLIREQIDPAKDERRNKLFDLVEDPGELKDLAAETARVSLIGALAAKIQGWIAENAKLAPKLGSLRGSGIDALKAMGYVGGKEPSKGKDQAPQPPPGDATESPEPKKDDAPPPK